MSSRALRAREALHVLRDTGARGFAQRVSRTAYRRLGAAELDFPLDLDDIADSRLLDLAVPARRPERGTPLSIGWVCTPPGPGSGGHTTMFRMVEAAEASGHACVLYLYDRFRGEAARHEQIIRQYWPRVQAEIRTVSDGFAPLDAYVATAWETAHILATRGGRIPTRRMYFIQDFEPYFYAHGSEYVLAEDTYRFGYHPIAVGRTCGRVLKERYGIVAPVAEYGCDTSVYRLTNAGERSGVVFYCKRDVPRRGFMLGLLALREFHRRHPDQEIHLFGDPTATAPFPVTNHGRLTTAELAELYNQVRAGIAISFTFLSLVPAEMSACGAIPIQSGGDFVAADLEGGYARWVEPTAAALADALSDAVTATSPTPAELAATASTAGWAAAQAATVRAIEDAVYGV